jgi:hypothetical protein
MRNYKYADPTSVGPRPPFQLEFWIPKGRKGGEWVQADALPAGHQYSRTWRKVLRGHSHKAKLSHSIASVKAGYARDALAQCKAYIDWARASGLRTVHVFPGCKSLQWVAAAGLGMIEVDPSAFIGPVSPDLENAA